MNYNRPLELTLKTEEVNVVCQQLKDLGWQEYPESNEYRAFYKRFPTATKCRCNSERDGANIGIHVHSYRNPP